MRTIKDRLMVLLYCSLVVFSLVSADCVRGNDTGMSGSVFYGRNTREGTSTTQTVHTQDKDRNDKKEKKREKEEDGERSDDDTRGDDKSINDDRGKGRDKDRDNRGNDDDDDKCDDDKKNDDKRKGRDKKSDDDDDERSDDEDDEDNDGDGYTGADDCDDNDSSINPNAREVCDGVDNNCDGQIDEGVKTTYYEDADGDGYGNMEVTQESCEQPPGYVTDHTDCDDTRAAVNPGATEIKRNGIDDDCNASTPDDDTGVNLPPDPGEAGKETLLGIDTDGDGVRDDIQRYIYFTYPDDEKLRLGLKYYAIEFQGVLKDADNRDLSYDHAIKMARHGECLFHLKGRESIYICRAIRAEILNTKERSIAYITYSDNLGGRVIRGAPRKNWNDSCSFDVDDTGGDQ